MSTSTKEENFVELITKSGVLFAAQESIRTSIGSVHIDLELDFAPHFSSTSTLAPAEKRRLSEWILSTETGFHGTLRSAFFGLCKFPETALFFRQNLGAFETSENATNHNHHNTILVKIVPVREHEATNTHDPNDKYHHQPYDVASIADRNKNINLNNNNNVETKTVSSPTTASIVVLTITFFLHVERDSLSHSGDMHRLEHAIAHAYYPTFQTARLLGRVAASGRIEQTSIFVQKLFAGTASPQMQIIFPFPALVEAMGRLEERIAAAEWVCGAGFHGTICGAFALFCRFAAGKTLLASKFNKISINLIPGSPAQDHDIVVSSNEIKLLHSILYITIFFKTGGVYLADSVDSHQLEAAILGLFPELKAGHTREMIQGSGEIEKVRQAISEATGQKLEHVSVDFNVDSICSLEASHRKNATQWVIGDDNLVHGTKRDIHQVLEEDEDSDDNKSVMTGATPSTTGTGAPYLPRREQAAINQRHPSPMLNTIKVAFAALCKYDSGKAELAKYNNIKINVMSAVTTGSNQPSDVAVFIDKIDIATSTIAITFTLRTARDLVSSSDSLQLARKISLAIPQIQRGKETDIVNKNGNWDNLQDNIRFRLQNYHLLFDIDFWSITNIENEGIRKDVLDWLVGEGLEQTLKKGVKSLMNNTLAIQVFDKFRRLEITCAVSTDDAKIHDIVSCAVTTANIDGVVGVVKSALVGAKASSATSSLEPGSIGSWRRLPALNLQFIFRAKERNIRSDYDCSLRLEQAVLGAIPQLKRAHDKDVVDTSSKIKQVQKDINQALFVTNAKYTSSSNLALRLKRVKSAVALLSTSENRRGSMYGLTQVPTASSLRRDNAKAKTKEFMMKKSNNNNTSSKDAIPTVSSSDSASSDDDDHDGTTRALKKVLSRIKVEFDYDDVLSLQDKDQMHAMTWLTTESAFAATMRLAFENLGHNQMFLSAFDLLVQRQKDNSENKDPELQQPEKKTVSNDDDEFYQNSKLQKIVLHVFSRFCIPENAIGIREKYLTAKKKLSASSSGTMAMSTDSAAFGASFSSSFNSPKPTRQQKEELFTVVPGEVIFEAFYSRPVLHINCVLCKDDASNPTLTCEARMMEKAILTCVRDLDH